MTAHPLDTDFAFPQLATRILDKDELASDTLDFPPDEKPLGIFRGLLAATMIEIGLGLLVILGWQVWHFLR